jgi:hypothetical protein
MKAVLIKAQVFWDVMLCQLVNGNTGFRTTV